MKRKEIILSIALEYVSEYYHVMNATYINMNFTNGYGVICK